MASQSNQYQEGGGAGEGSNEIKTPERRITQQPRSKIPRLRRQMVITVEDPQRNCDINVSNYLDSNEEFLESYIMENVPLSKIKRWLFKKRSSTESKITVVKKTIEKPSPKNRFLELFTTLNEETSEHSIVIVLTRSICMSIGVEAYRVYKLYPDDDKLVEYFETIPDQTISTRLVQVDLKKVEHVLHVAKNGFSVRYSRDDSTGTFPTISITLLEAFGIKNAKEANHVLYQPLLSAKGKTAYVIEMWRIKEQFEDRDVEICSNFIVWGSLTLQYCNLYLVEKRERNMADFLLEVVKAIFEEMVSLEQLVKKILEFAQKIVNADRASLFLVDHKSRELVSTLFDLKYESGQGPEVEKKEIRMPIDRGLAGIVALTGETVNIPDAYSDNRFNRDVDEVPGYKTNNILCMPVRAQGEIIGVVQMENKINTERFDHEDESRFKRFSNFFGLALHHARLSDKIYRKKQNFEIALEVLSYHNTCKEPEAKDFIENHRVKTGNVDSLTDFYFDPCKLNDMEKCNALITMFDDLFDLSNFDYMTVTRFILTVKKNYRAVPYHNFDHAWSVAQAMYVIIKNDHNNSITYKMRLALFVACLCHDLDHQGYPNKYLNEKASPLAAMYTTSPLEHLHFNFTVTILQQNGHNIFSHLTAPEYKDILEYIRKCILATDLASFLPNLEKLPGIDSMSSQGPQFDWSLPSHREIGMAILMTAADLSASAKPWEIQMRTVQVMFEELYNQGDEEKKAGKTPIPMMDRTKPEEQPASQVDFLSQICIPCYISLYKILPQTKPMYTMALENLNNWKSKVTICLDSSGEEETVTLELLTEDKVSEKSESLQDIRFGDSNKVEEIKDIDDEKEKNICEKTAGLKCIKSVSAQNQKTKVIAKTKEIKVRNYVKENLDVTKHQKKKVMAKEKKK